MTITDCTIANNSSPLPPPDFRIGPLSTLQTNSGGNIENLSGAVTLTNTIVANAGSGENCGGTIINGGTNLQFPGTTCGAAITTGDPLLQPLANNGGRRRRGPRHRQSRHQYRNDGLPAHSATDQRGVLRPQGVGCEIGAFECRPVWASAGGPGDRHADEHADEHTDLDADEHAAGVATNTPTVTATPTRTTTPIAGVVVPTLTFRCSLLGLALAGARFCS